MAYRSARFKDQWCCGPDAVHLMGLKFGLKQSQISIHLCFIPLKSFKNTNKTSANSVGTFCLFLRSLGHPDGCFVFWLVNFQHYARHLAPNREKISSRILRKCYCWKVYRSNQEITGGTQRGAFKSLYVKYKCLSTSAVIHLAVVPPFKAP